MSENDVELKPARRVTGMVLSGLAAGAVLGVTVAAEPALAADTGTTAVVVTDPDAQRPAGQSLRDQFRTAFTAGVLVDSPIETAKILIPEH
jgi:hypothetical protein